MIRPFQLNSHDANAPRPGDSGQNEEALQTGVNCPQGGVGTECAGAASLPRMVAEYYGAYVLVDGACLRIVLCKHSNNALLQMDLFGGEWTHVRAYIWERPRSEAAIASAREILGRFYGEPAK